MNLQKLNPWNWFSHEDEERNQLQQVPVTRRDLPYSSHSLSQTNPLLRMHQEMDRLFDEAFSRFGFPSTFTRPESLMDSSLETLYRPSLDIAGTNSGYQISLDVPGMNQADITIEISGDRLILKGQKEEKSENKDRQFYRVERNYGAFQRTLSLPDDANVDDITAKLENGVLKLEIPRVETASRNIKRIEISS
jgi:HSP20 family protein